MAVETPQVRHTSSSMHHRAHASALEAGLLNLGREVSAGNSNQTEVIPRLCALCSAVGATSRMCFLCSF